jgi:hypothetical protein
MLAIVALHALPFGTSGRLAGGGVACWPVGNGLVSIAPALGTGPIIDVPTIAIATLLVLVKAKKVPEPIVIVAAGLSGLAVSP